MTYKNTSAGISNSDDHKSSSKYYKMTSMNTHEMHATGHDNDSTHSPKRRAKKRWILSITSGMRSAVKRNKAYATCTHTETQKINIHDAIIFYVLGTGRFDGIYEAQTRWHEPAKKWPFRVTDEIGLSSVKSGTAGVRSIAASLQFVKRSRWIGLHLHAGIGNYGRPISSKDCSTISKRMQGIQSTLH